MSNHRMISDYFMYSNDFYSSKENIIPVHDGLSSDHAPIEIELNFKQDVSTPKHNPPPNPQPNPLLKPPPNPLPKPSTNPLLKPSTNPLPKPSTKPCTTQRRNKPKPSSPTKPKSSTTQQNITQDILENKILLINV